jgi:hypothetical protein
MIEEMEIKVRNLLQEVGVPWTADLTLEPESVVLGLFWQNSRHCI